MKDVLIIAHFTQIIGETGNGRFNYIAEHINKESAVVELVTTSFSHKTKRQRYIPKELIQNLNYKLTMLYEPGYRKNVSLKRLYSHYIFGQSLKKYLYTRKRPDVIYCAVPSLSAAKIAALYAMKNNIRFIIDVQDIWPEAFRMVFKIPILSDLFFFTMQKQADFIYSTANNIVAVSKTYLDRALKVNKKCKEAHSIFLGTELEYFDKLANDNGLKNKPKNEIWLAYVGTLGHSYDLISVIDALKILKDQGINNIKFVVMGDGPLKSKFENYAKNKGIYVEFTGRLDYGKMVGILCACDIAVNPINRGAASSIINKHADYAAAGLPVINTQESAEYRKIVEEYCMGLNCIPNDPVDISRKILQLYNDEILRNKIGKNSRRLAEDLFDRKKTYKKIYEIILQ